MTKIRISIKEINHSQREIADAIGNSTEHYAVVKYADLYKNLKAYNSMHFNLYVARFIMTYEEARRIDNMLAGIRNRYQHA